MIVASILVPVCAGLLLLLPGWKNRKNLCIYTAVILALSGVLAVAALFVTKDNVPVTVFSLTRNLPVLFKADGISRFFAAVTTVVWLAAGLYSFSYMSREKREKGYYGFYLIVYGILLGLDFAGNIITFYVFYELMTLASLPLVMHTRTREAVLAGLKYLFFSLAGAYMVLFGIYFLNRYANTLTFTAGGVLDMSLLEGKGGLLLTAAFLMLFGFGVKAGMYPMHVWLTAAHPVAPAPASAALSGVIVKAGVLGVVRTVYFLFGTEFIRGTWVQKTWLALILVTILTGSAMACREKALKKRLAYSTVSQVSYILLGIALLTPQGFVGALLHTGSHALMKCGLFLTAGAIIRKTGKTRVDELAGIGKKMPATMWCFLVFSLSLIGMPPFAGFVSKWYLGLGCMESGLPVYGVLGAVILLVSAMLTALYLLPIAVKGFLPGKGYRGQPGEVSDEPAVKREEAPLLMCISMAVLALAVLLLGMFPGKILESCGSMAGILFKGVAG